MAVGVKVSTSTIPGPASSDPQPGSGYFVVGQTTRGNPTLPTLVQSLPAFSASYGPAYSFGFLTNDLTTFFSELGTHAWVRRVVGTGAVAASLTLNDRAGSPLATLKITAGCGSISPSTGINLGNVADPGTWGNQLAVAVTDSLVTNNFLISIYQSGSLVETWGPYPNVAAAVLQINTSSAYVQATNMFSATFTGGTPSNANPADLSATSLSGGADDPGTVTSSVLGAALASFTADLGPGIVAIPGYDGSLVGAALVAHETANSRIATISPTQGLSSTAAASAAATFRGTTGSEGAGYAWPWVTVPNGSGGTLTVPPDGFIAGRYSATVAAIGPWQAPAGAFGAARFVTGLDPASGVVNDTVGDSLNDNHVNVIRPKQGTRLYGWRSLSTDTLNYELLTQKATLNLLAWQIGNSLQQYVFAVIDAQGQLFDQIDTDILQILQPLIDAGALFPGPVDSSGAPSDPGWLIDTGSDINTPLTLQANQALVATYVRLSPSAELILASVNKVAVAVAF